MAVLIKIYNLELLKFDNQEKMSRVLREDFLPYQIKCDVNTLNILENQNMILCSLLYAKCDYEQSKDGIIKVFKKNNQQFTVMEIKIENDFHLKQFKDSFRQKSTMDKFKGPLSYTPIEMERVSLLSSESPEQNYRGFMNLFVLILIANHIRLIVENFVKYGFLLKELPFLTAKYDFYPVILVHLVIGVAILVGYGISYIQFTSKLSSPLIVKLNVINMSFLFCMPLYVVKTSHPTINLILLMETFIFLMKLISYAHVVRNCKYTFGQLQQNEKAEIGSHNVSDENLQILRKYYNRQEKFLNFKHYLYFMAAPTLCYQLSYPRSSKIRKVWVAKRFVELIVVYSFQILVWYQYVEPLLQNTYKTYEEEQKIFSLRMLERLLKMGIPNTYIWISAFYAQFQVFLNILAELLKFGDRQFYRDWWNCKTLAEYWRLWNLPVHQWLTRHVYFPLLKRKVPKAIAGYSVFFVSAVGHEYLISGALGIVTYWAFFGMFLQAPVIYFQAKIEKIFKIEQSQLGNVMFWISFCFLGQPLLIFVYYYYFLKKYSDLYQ